MILTNRSKKAKELSSPVIKKLLAQVNERTGREWIAEEFTRHTCFSTFTEYFLLRKVENPTGDLDWQLSVGTLTEENAATWLAGYLNYLDGEYAIDKQS
jgi:hypothetical protein